MDRRRNPFAPGAGIQPPELAGRDQLISDATIDMQRAMDGKAAKSIMILGLRGVGKTVLINRLVDIASSLGFKTAKVEAPEGGKFLQLLAPQLRAILYQLDLRHAAGVKMREAVSTLRNFVAAFKVTVGNIEFGVEPSPGRADTGNLQYDLADLLIAVSEVAKERRSAVGLFIDEVQYLSADELAAIVISCHEIAQQRLPLFFVGAGLPQIAALAGNAKSYAERLFDYPQVDSLDRSAARSALEKPIIDAGASIEEAAIDAIITETRGYPYFIQEWGARVWNQAPSDHIVLDDVLSATPGVIAHLDANFFRVRFDRLTALQQKYLRAMAELGPGPHKTGAIATVLGVEPAEVATTRAQLIKKGMVWSQRHGETAFTAPLFDQFMRRQMPDLDRHSPKRKAQA